MKCDNNLIHGLVLFLVFSTIVFLVVSVAGTDFARIEPGRLGSSTFAILMVNFTVILFSYKDRMKNLYSKKDKASLSRFFTPISLFTGLFLSYGGIILSAQNITAGSQEAMTLSICFIGSVLMMALSSIVFFAKSEE